MRNKVKEILSRILEGANSKKFFGLTGASKSAVVGALSLKHKKLLLITAKSEDAERFKHEIHHFRPEARAVVFPAPDESAEIAGRRLSALSEMLSREECVLISSLRAIESKTSLPKAVRIQKGSRSDFYKFIADLSGAGYRRLPVVGERGEFSVRGGIVDVFPSNSEEPVRIEFFGDKVDSIRSFDPISQRSKLRIESADILQSAEEEGKNILELLPYDAVVLFDEKDVLNLNAELLGLSEKFISYSLSAWVSPPHEPLFPPEHEIFGIKLERPKIHARKNEGVGEDIRADFREGDFVVHEDYGIGIYRGLHKIEEGEFILIEFADGDKLYVPPHLMGKIEKYVSEEGYSPKLSKMGGVGWLNLKRRVKKTIKDLTQELLALYSDRAKAVKTPYGEDDEWQRELEDSFPYEETQDQLNAMSQIKKDLESNHPMDRLLCGDVGYGKTEVALRAVVKVLSGGKQVAILVPTTILAEQHYHYFKDRLAALPFRIESLSRFKSKEEQKKIIDQLKTGEVDVVIGTHRLLQKDVGFSNLGLLVVDEEHRFGVSHKEKLKKLKKDIDILSMTATPIPRTLYMALSGTRDLSIIQTPPADRSPVRTYVAAFNETLVKEAVLRELDRGGQVYFVHNYIESIDSTASRIKKLLPQVKIAVAHGRINEASLEKIMDDFLDKKYDILLCTAIIESGLDIPNVNTILINYADRFGLAQLYQLRGRVGRSPVRAYAYLLYHQNEISTRAALTRLQAISEFTSLGSGYKLALRDLEIRGAGNILGAEQHGHMLAVGFDLYCELLSEAVSEIKGIKEPTPRQVLIELKEDALIPSDYIEDEGQRVAVYRRLNLIGSEGEIEDMKEELKDRFGKIPPQCFKLFDIVRLKAKAQKAGIKSIRGDSAIYVDWFDGRGKKFRLKTQDKIREIAAQIGL